MSRTTIAEELATTIKTIGGDMLYQTAVVVGSAAIYFAFPESARRPHDIDLSVPNDIYEQLRSLPSWQVCETTYRTKNILRSRQCDIGVGWGGMDHTALFKRSWQTTDGLHIANISTIYSWKQARTAAKDKKDAAIIRKNLHTPLPVSADILKYEIARLTSCLPVHLRHHATCEWAMHLAAHGLLVSFSQNYHPHLFHSQSSIESLTLFNHVEDCLSFVIQQLRQVLAHPAIALFSIEEQFLAVTSLLYSNLLYHHHAQRTAPDLPSIAPLAARHALIHGYTLPQAKRIHRIIDDFGQKSHTDPLARAIQEAIA